MIASELHNFAANLSLPVFCGPTFAPAYLNIYLPVLIPYLAHAWSMFLNIIQTEPVVTQFLVFSFHLQLMTVPWLTSKDLPTSGRVMNL